VLALLYGTNQDPKVYSNEDKFDPARFSERGEDTKAKCPLFAYVPQGGGDPEKTHRCVGELLIRNVAKLTLVQLIGLYEWKLPQQDLSLNWKQLRPLPKSGVKIAFMKISPEQESKKEDSEKEDTEKQDTQKENTE